MTNASGADASTTTYVVCIKRPKSHYSLASAGYFDAPPDQRSFGEAYCSSGVVVGGGVIGQTSTNPLTVASQIPDPSAAGWQVWMNNDTSNDLSFATYAICRNPKPGGYRIVSGPTTTNPAGTQTQTSVECPGARVPLSGGDSTSSGSTLVNGAASYPSGQQWFIAQSNASTADTDARAWVVCS